MQESRRRRWLELRLLPLRAARARLRCAALVTLIAAGCSRAAPPATPAPPPPAPTEPTPAPAPLPSTVLASAPGPSRADGSLVRVVTAKTDWLPPRALRRRVPARFKPFVSDTPPLPLPEGTTVLHIGDSFAGALGIALNRDLEQHGIRGLLRYRTASYIPTWAHGDEVSRIVQTYHPSLVLITLGANEIEIAEPEQRAAAIRRLVAALHGRPCVWIAPPLWEQGNGLLDVIRENCGPCRFMDTNAYIHGMPRVKDGIHPTMEAREMWAKVVLGWLARERSPTPTEPWALRPGP